MDKIGHTIEIRRRRRKSRGAQFFEWDSDFCKLNKSGETGLKNIWDFVEERNGRREGRRPGGEDR